LKEFTRDAASGHKVKMGFCENCGSSVHGRSERWPHLRIVSASSLDDSKWFSPDMYVWTQDAPSWVVFDPVIPRFLQDAVQGAITPLKTQSILTYDAFERVDLRSGTVVKVQDFARAKKPAFKIWADFGTELGILQTSAQVTEHYTPESLMGRKIVGCVNLGEKNIAGFQSQFLLLGFADDNGAICLITANPEVPNGQKLH
jgi:tRNA-binding protein